MLFATCSQTNFLLKLFKGENFSRITQKLFPGFWNKTKLVFTLLSPEATISGSNKLFRKCEKNKLWIVVGKRLSKTNFYSSSNYLSLMMALLVYFSWQKWFWSSHCLGKVMIFQLKQHFLRKLVLMKEFFKSQVHC